MPDKHFGVGEESTWNTAVAPTTFFRLRSENFRRVPAIKTSEHVGLLAPQDAKILTDHWEGEATVEGNYEDIGVIAKHLLGPPSTSGVGPYTHTFPPGTGPSKPASEPGLTFESKRSSDTGVSWRYAGGKVEGITLEWGTDDFALFTLRCFGGSETNPGAATESLGTFTPILPGHVAVTFDAAAIDHLSGRINIDFPVDHRHNVGSQGFPKEPAVRDKMLVTGEIQARFPNRTEYDKWVSLTEIDLAIVCTGPSGVSLTYNANKIILTGDPTPHVSDREPLIAAYSFEGMANTGHQGNANAEVVLVNNVSSL